MKSIPPTIMTPRPRVGRKRRKATPPPGPVTVLAVTLLDANRVYWKFSSPVLGWDDVTGFTVDGQSPIEVGDITPEGWLPIRYDGEITGGDPWTVETGVAISFEGGGDLELPESGAVTT